MPRVDSRESAAERALAAPSDVDWSRHPSTPVDGRLDARRPRLESPRVRPWRVIESTLLLDRTWLRVHEQRIALPGGGEIGEFHLIEAPSWAAALALTEAGEVLMVEQYRHGASATSLELPAGVIDGNEDPRRAAQRELREEAGFEADDWTPLLTVSPEPARNTSRGHFFIARGARRAGDQRLDATEDIAVRAMKPDALVAAVLEGRVLHGAHVAAILAARARGWLGTG